MKQQLSAFDPTHHQESLEHKIIASMEKLSQVFRVLLWKDAREESLSPIQVQILIHLCFQQNAKRNISTIAKTFNMTKATVSDSVKLLEQKDLIRRENSTLDNRRHALILTEKGAAMAGRVAQFANPLIQPIEEMPQHQKEVLYQSLLELIHKLNLAGIVQPVNMCFSCSFYQKDAHHYCKLMQKQLTAFELQVDCPDHLR